MNLIVALVLVFATADGLQEPRLVYPRLLEERSSDGKLVLHIHDGLTLNLEQASVAAPQLRVIEELDDATITLMHDGNEINSNLYQDRQQLATVEVKRRENSAEITGIVGPDHRIEPAPAMERSESGLIPHLVHEIKHIKVQDNAVPFFKNVIFRCSNLTSTGQYGPLGIQVKGSRLTARDDYNNYGYPSKVTVEVFLVTDDTYYSRFKGPKEALVYACMLLNSVNLRLSDMYSPTVTLALTGIQSCRSQDGLYHSYALQYDMYALSSFQKYGVKMKAEFGNPDILFHLSGSDESYGNSFGATGIAYVGGVCSEYYVGLAQDDATLFSGVYIVTHELGHLLGCEHDGSSGTSVIEGHPGATSCSWNDGYVMSYVDKGANHQQFSHCSFEQMRFVLNKRGKDCWKIVSRTRNVTRKYPGYRPDLNMRICKTIYPNKQNLQAIVIKENGDECKLSCKVTESGGSWYSTIKDAPDFSSCGGSEACVKGRCIRATIRRKNATGRRRR